MKNIATSFYTGIFCLAGLVMALQILQSRLFSVTSWYHLSFLVISMAMFGLTLGALKVYRADEKEYRKNYGLFIRKHCMGFGFFILIALASQLFVPIISDNIIETIATLPIAAFTTSLAYYHAGVAITICLTRAPFPVGKTYGFDLLGAGLGCIVALILMETIDTPSAIIMFSGLAFMSALLFPVEKNAPKHLKISHITIPMKKFSILFFLGTLLVGGVNASLNTPLLYPIWVKNKIVPISTVEHEKWNSISRVTVFKEQTDQKPFSWGPSPKFPEDARTTGRYLNIDGDAGTPITKFDGDFSKHKYLEYDVTNIAYTMPNIKKSAIIGVGGGRDLLSAKYFGVEEVTALDVNPVQIDLLRDNPKYRDYAGLYNLPGVTIKKEEARSWFRQNDEKLDLIQMSLIDTWAATGAGAFALSENGLYTVEAWSVFMNDLNDNGVFTLSRWSADVMDDTGRSLSVAMATLFEQGVTEPQKHIALINSAQVATLILSKSPFTGAQIKALEKTIKQKDYTAVVMPNKPAPEGLIGDLLAAKTIDDLYGVSSTQFFDVSPSTDKRPFFFNQARITKPIDIIKLNLQPTVGSEVAMGQAKATFNLYLIIIFSLLMVVFAIVNPLLKTIKNKKDPFIQAGTLYFLLIGLGFMFVEISLLQALGVFLGHPIYGLSVVLFSLIISAGLGSLISEKISLTTLPRQLIWCALTCGYGIVLALYLFDVFFAFSEVDMVTRILVGVAIVLPAGVLMGFGFPTGLAITEKFDSRATAWFWGINGAAGVLGSSLAIAFNISLGIDKTLIVASGCYALLAIAFVSFRNQQKA